MRATAGAGVQASYASAASVRTPFLHSPSLCRTRCLQVPHPPNHLSLCLCRRFSEGIYVLYTYTAAPSTGQAVQKYLSTPTASSEINILR